MSDSLTLLPRNTPRWALLAFERERLAGVVPLRTQPVRVGRGEGCDLRLSDHSVSREHCRFELVDGEVLLVDLRSRNGTVRFGRRLLRSRLHEGDEIALGNAMVKLVDLARPGWSIDGNLYEDLYLDVETGLLNWRGFLSRVDSLLALVLPEREAGLVCLRLLSPAATATDPAARAAWRRFGEALRAACFDDCTVAHQGNGEFACFFQAGGADAARAFIERLRDRLAGQAALKFASGVAVMAEPTSFSSLWCAAQDELYMACAGSTLVSVRQRTAHG